MEIREQLARRFYLRVHRGGNMPGLIDDWSTVQDKWRWEVMADECLRQMAWTAVEVAHDYRSSEGFDSREGAEKAERGRKLTLAPDDWTP